MTEEFDSLDAILLGIEDLTKTFLNIPGAVFKPPVLEISSADEMKMIGKKFAQSLLRNPEISRVLALTGDVGVGKTTFTQGLAAGLGVKDPVNSPSFTISKTYAFPGGFLTHYDFYRLDDPGIMREDLEEKIADGHFIVIEWGASVSDLLPENHLSLDFTYQKDGSRQILIRGLA